MNLKTGDVFHGFKILDECGRGGYGIVYRAEDMLGRQVALKIITSVSSEAGKRELHGLKAYAKNILFSHSELIAIYHADMDEDCLYYTMELADNIFDSPERYAARALNTRIKEEKCLKIEEIIEIADRLLGAIKTLHSYGLAHRDIKPGNIIYAGGNLKLSDIGLISDNVECSLVGTGPFMPPEKQNSKGSLSKADDFYAFGKTLYVLFTGRRAEEFPALGREFILSEPSKRMNQFIMKLAATDPAKRISDFSVIQAALSTMRRKLKMPDKQKKAATPLVKHLFLDEKWDDKLFDQFLFHLESNQRDMLKDILKIKKGMKFNSTSEEVNEIKKQLLWRYSSMLAYPFKSNKLTYHEMVSWIAEKKAIRKRERLVYNTFQLEYRIFEQLLKAEGSNAGSFIEKTPIIKDIQKKDIDTIVVAIAFLYNIKLKIIEQHYDELPVKPKYPCELKESPKTV